MVNDCFNDLFANRFLIIFLLILSGEVVMVQDFAENRKAVYAEEIKSAHFGEGQITVHPVSLFLPKWRTYSSACYPPIF